MEKSKTLLFSKTAVVDPLEICLWVVRGTTVVKCNFKPNFFLFVYILKVTREHVKNTKNAISIRLRL